MGDYVYDVSTDRMVQLVDSASLVSGRLYRSCNPEPLEPLAFFEPNNDDPEKMDLYIENGNGPILFVTISDFHTDHIWNLEYRNGVLFALRRFRDRRGLEHSEAGWRDELWRYGRNGKSQMLFRSQGISFRANMPGTMIAVSAHSSIHFIDGEGSPVRQVTLADLNIGDAEGLSLQLHSWSEDSDTFFFFTERRDYWIRTTDWHSGRCANTITHGYEDPEFGVP
jgi:hypothetical protein